MPKKKPVDLNAVYLPPRIKQRLQDVYRYPTTCVEAPAGYGKTTTLAQMLPPGAGPARRVLWFTAWEGEAPYSSWARFCRLFAQIDAAVAEALEAAAFPCADNIGEISQLLKNFSCEGETFLVIDGLEHWAAMYPAVLPKALATHAGGPFHLVLLTQPLKRKGLFLANSSVLHVTGEALALSPEEIQAYFSIAGLSITPVQAQAIWQATEGWFAAVYLHLLHYAATGQPAPPYGHVLELMRECLWNRLEKPAQTLLLELSCVPYCTLEQILFYLDIEEPPAWAGYVMQSSGFVRYDAEAGLYYPHTILRRLVRNLFLEQSITFQKAAWEKAGRWQLRQGDKLSALASFYYAEDFESIFAMDLSNVEIHPAGQDITAATIEDILERVPQKLKLRYPVTLLAFAYELFSAGRYAQYGALCEEIAALIPKTDFPEEEKSRLFGELALMQSFAEYNDIEQMGRCHAAAWDLIGGPSRLVDTSVPWTMGAASVLYMFHRQPGALQQELGSMRQYLPAYLRLADGHGSGADCLMDAEAELYHGNFEQAKILALRGAHLAAAAKQDSLSLCAHFLLARLALVAGQPQALQEHLAAMEHFAGPQAPSVQKAFDMASSQLWLMLDRPEKAALWVAQGNFAVGIQAPALPWAQLIHLLYCFGVRNYTAVHSLAEPFLAASSMNILPQIYIHTVLACTQYRNGGIALAQKHMKCALALALPDRLFLPLAEFGADILPLLATRPDTAFGQDTGAVRALALQVKEGKEKIGRALDAESRPFALTVREYEIALLAAQRKSNNEIAEITCLSVATVRTHLQSVYEKLKIDSKLKSKRYLLAGMLLEP